MKLQKIQPEDTLVQPKHDSEWQDIFDQDPYQNPLEDFGLPPSESSYLLSDEEVIF